MKVVFAPSIAWPGPSATAPNADTPDPNLLQRALEQVGVHVVVVNPHRFPWNPLAGKDTLLQSFDLLRALRLLAQHRDADVIVSVFEGAAASLGALRWLLPRRTKLAMWDLGLTTWRFRNRVIDFTLPKIDGLLVLSGNQPAYIAQHHRPCRQILNIGHLIDTTFFRPADNAAASGVVSVGDDIGRDFKTLVEATRELDEPIVIKASRNPPHELHGGIRLVTERISHAALRQMYVDAKVVAIPTAHTPNACGVSSLLEAGAMGKAAVVSDNPALAEFCRHGETCLVVPSGDARALREALTELLRKPELRERLGRNAREHVLQHHSPPVFAHRFAQALQQLTGTRSRP